MSVRCLYCDRPITSYTFRSLFLKEDELCPECRRKLKVKRKYIDMEGFRVETFFDYEGMFRDLLLQYKECHDEALKDVFLYDLREYLEWRYHGYHMVFIPSSEKKRKERGFDHLKMMFRLVQLERLEGLKMIDDRSQEGRNREDRRKMADNYTFIGPFTDKILIIDDVMTTGSSLKGAFRCLSGHAKETKVISLAYKNITLHY